MVLLALDTTSRPGSLAVLREGTIVCARAADGARAHGQQLPAAIVEVLHDVGLELADVSLYAVSVGPGSFTGLRVGIATIQGLALVHARQVVGVSALEALAWWGRSKGAELLAPWIDAQRGEVFAAVYGRTPPRAGTTAGHVDLVEVEPPMVGRPSDVLDTWRHRPFFRHVAPLFLGSGAGQHQSVIASVFAAAAIISESPVLAGAVAEIAGLRAAHGGAVHPHAIVPVYVRRPDVELARERPHDPRRTHRTVP